MTDLFLAGAENQQHQALLTSCASDKVAVNIGALLRRAAFSTWTLDLPYPDWEWIAYTDGPVAELDLEQALAKAAKPPLFVVGSEMWENHPLYLPLVNVNEPALIDPSKGFFITDYVFNDDAGRRAMLGLKKPGMTMGVITGQSDRSIGRFDYVISSAWYSTMKYGETQVFDGQKMCRYNSKSKGEARKKHTKHMRELGIDPTPVLADDADAVARLAITSWNAYGKTLGLGVVPATNPAQGLVPGTGTGVPAIAGTTPTRRQQVIMPGMGTDSVVTTHTDVNGITSQQSVPLIRSGKGMIRNCNNCHLATAGCPGYQAGAQCAYELPVEIKTREQLQATMEAIIEIQAQRVFQARFSEELQGQELAPATGREIERLFKITEKMTDILDDRESFRMTVKAKADSGVVSRLFGPKMGEQARQLASPIDSNDILDATVVDG